jgi:hypothetical protein
MAQAERSGLPSLQVDLGDLGHTDNLRADDAHSAFSGRRQNLGDDVEIPMVGRARLL